MLWGATNPMLRAGSDSIKDEKRDGTRHERSGGQVRNLCTDIIRLFSEWRFVVPFCINQLGSIMHVWLLGNGDMSVVIPCCNALTFIFTAIVSWLMGEQLVNIKELVIGGTCIVLGVAISFQEG
eukprot:g1070.t1